MPAMTISSRRRATTLIEMSVAIGIAAFVFAALGSLTYMATRNLYNIHEQLQSQQSAASSFERMCHLFREAGEYALYSGDPESTITRVKFRIKPPYNGPTKFGVVCWDRMTSQVLWFDDEAKVTFNAPDEPVYDAQGDGPDNDADDPSQVYRNVSGLGILWRTKYWLTLNSKFEYRGFALMLTEEGKQLGDFVTDVRARNVNPFAP